MKKNVIIYNWYVLLALCCTLFVACETNSVADNKNIIGFNSGRTLISSISEPNALLWGYYGDVWVYGNPNEDESVVGGDNAKYDGYEVLTAVTRYWAQTTEKYNFYSMYPMHETVTDVIFNVSDKNITFTYDDIEEQVDLCMASALGVPSQWNVAKSKIVNLTYKHLLSMVQFKAFSAIDGITVKVKSVAITTPKSATYTYTTADDFRCDVKEESAFISYTKPVENGQQTYFNLSFGGDGTMLDPNLNDDEAGFLIFSGNTNVELRIEYLDAFGVLKSGDDTKVVLKVPEGGFLPGKNYTYTVNIKTSGEIIFGDVVKVNDWDYNNADNDQDLHFDTTKKNN